jgi:hypothetical protein
VVAKGCETDEIRVGRGRQRTAVERAHTAPRGACSPRHGLHACERDAAPRGSPGEISSRFSVFHSSRNSRMGALGDPTEMYAMSARFFTSPHACNTFKKGLQ